MSSHATAVAEKASIKKDTASSAGRRSDSALAQRRSSDQMLYVQRTISNQAMGRLLGSVVVQPKLTISQPGDVYEQEADRVADEAMRMPEHAIHAKPTCPCAKDTSGKEEEIIQPNTLQITPFVQRQQIEEEEEKIQTKPMAVAIASLLQRRASRPEELSVQQGDCTWDTMEAGPTLESRIDSIRGAVHSLDRATRAFFEPRFGYDFSQVRVHTDVHAAELVGAMNALAFTVGRDVVLGLGQSPQTTAEGMRLMAHELTHVVQQSQSAPQGRLGMGKPHVTHDRATHRNSDQHNRMPKHAVVQRWVYGAGALPHPDYVVVPAAERNGLMTP